MTIDGQHHKNSTNGHTKRAPLQGVHTYLYPCSFHVFLQISSCTSPLSCSLAEKLFVLTETCTVQALFGSREPIPSHISAQSDRQEKGIRPAKV